MHHEDEVRLIAYELWEDEGRPDGKDLDHWLRAEAIWAERQLPELGKAAGKPAGKEARRTTATKHRGRSRRSAK